MVACQVIGKRKKMLSDMVPGLRGELRAMLTAQTAEGVEFMLGQLDRQLGGLISHEAEWYNADEQLSDALNEMLRALAPKTMHRYPIQLGS